MVQTRSGVATCFEWESEPDQSSAEAMVVCFLGTFDDGYGRYACSMGFPYWECLEWVLWYHHRYNFIVVCFEVCLSRHPLSQADE